MADIFQQAIEHHRRGELAEAAGLYERIIAEQPAHADALHLLGVVLHQDGQNDQALKLIQEAIRIRPEQAIYYCNLSNVQRALGHSDDALASCEKALEIQPGMFEAQLNKGLILLRSNQAEKAEPVLRAAIEARPDDSRAYTYLGECLTALQQEPEAMDAYRTALDKDPLSALAHSGLGLALLSQGEPEAAYPHLKSAAELLPDSAIAIANHARCMVELGRVEEGLTVFDDAMQIEPTVLEINLEIGNAWIEAHDLDEAEGWFQRVLRLHPDQRAAWTGLARIAANRRQFDQAIAQYQAVLQQNPNYPNALNGLADVYWQTGDRTAAIEFLKKLVLLQPNRADRHARLGEHLARFGDEAAAVASFRAALKKNPRCPAALAGLAAILRGQLPDSERQQLEALLPRLARFDCKAALALGLAHVHDDRGEFAQAAEYLQKGNAWKKQHWRRHGRSVDHDQLAAFTEAIIQHFNAEFFARVDEFGIDSHRPVFVVGLPNSGTAVVERLLASHPQVFVAGPRHFVMQAVQCLPDAVGEKSEPLACLQKITPLAVRTCASRMMQQLDQLDGGKALRIADTTGENYYFVGFIKLMFPDARIIHCRRDPRDLALACYMANESNLYWSNDLEEIARRFNDCQRLTAHWRRLFPERFIDIDFESLVTDSERAAKRLVQSLGLPWSQDCLKKGKPGATELAKAGHKQSIGRWKQYEALLEPFVRNMPEQQ